MLIDISFAMTNCFAIEEKPDYCKVYKRKNLTAIFMEIKMFSDYDPSIIFLKTFNRP